MDEHTPMPSTADKMKAVKLAWEKAPSGPQKDKALRHFQAAERAQAAEHDGECNRQLDSAARALA